METTIAEKETDTSGTPRWVKVFGIVAALVIALIVVLFVIGGPEHGPRRHGQPGAGSAHAPPLDGHASA